MIKQRDVELPPCGGDGGGRRKEAKSCRLDPGLCGEQRRDGGERRGMLEIGSVRYVRPLVGTWEDGRLVNRCFVGGKERASWGKCVRAASTASQLQDRSTR